MLYEARYTAQMVRDRSFYQQLGRSSIEHGIEPSTAAQLVDRLGPRMGNYALFTATTYDMAHVAVQSSSENRNSAAIDGLALAGFLELVDDTMDTPFPGRTRQDEENFLRMNIDSLLGGDTGNSIPDLFIPGRLDVCSDVAGYCRTRLHPESEERRDRLGEVFGQFIDATLAQRQTTDPEELLRISMNIFGSCMELAMLPCEFVDNMKYPDVRKAAWWYGAMCGVLDHGSEILDDIAEGSTTYATALLYQQGISAATLKQIRSMRKDAARDCFNIGLQMLESKEQRSIFRAIAFVAVANNMKKRIRDIATPRTIASAMANASQVLVAA